MRAKFNDGSEEFIDQCVEFKRVCHKCGKKIEDDTVLICSSCGEKRERCRSKAMANEEVCRAHAVDRHLSIYNIVSSKISDTTMDELIERGNLRDMTAEFALAKLAIAELHKNSNSPKDRLDALEKVFSIAEKLQRIESGGLLNVNWADPLIVSVRSKFRQLIILFKDLILEFVKDEEVQQIILNQLRVRSKMIGNSITIKPAEDGVSHVIQSNSDK